MPREKISVDVTSQQVGGGKSHVYAGQHLVSAGKTGKLGIRGVKVATDTLNGKRVPIGIDQGK